MLDHIALENILFLDIETVPQQSSFEELSEAEQQLWMHKASVLKITGEPSAIYDRAGIYAEFGKIVCISTGYFLPGKTREFRVKSFCNEDEKDILKEFARLLEKHFSRSKNLLCGHNGKEFDFPYLSRRMIINNIKLPALLSLSGKKPWEVQHIDTMDIWRFGDYKNYTPLNLLAHVLGISTPKDDIDGSMVCSVYWKEKNLSRIVSYCQKDVITLAQIILKMKGQPLLDAVQIKIV